MRKTILLVAFFLTSTLTLSLSILFLLFISSQKNSPFLSFGKIPKVSYAAIPNENESLLLKVSGQDARISAVKDFFSYYKSVLTPYAGEIVAAADKYGLDYKIVPAIAMQESTLCKNLPVKYKNTHNCWGFGIYGKKVTSFDSYSEAIDIVTKTLATKYKAQGLETPEEIMTKYNPVSTGTWAAGVSGYMARLTY